jgi:hypothetical protein
MILGSILLIVIIIVIGYIFLNDKSLTELDFKSADKIELYNRDFESSDSKLELLKTLTEESDIIEFSDFMEGIKSQETKGNCGYYLIVKYYIDNKVYDLEFGTDDCGSICYGNENYILNSENNKEFKVFVNEELGLPFFNWVSE